MKVKILCSGRIPSPPTQELKLASFHELASVNSLAEGLNASLVVKPFFEGYTRHFWQTFINICKVKQTLTTGVLEISWNSREKHERKAHAEIVCELRKESSRSADGLQFLVGKGGLFVMSQVLDCFPLNRSRQFLSHIYSGQNDISCNCIVLFCHTKLL